MVKERRGPRGLLPLTPAVLHILLALADEERHGYGIMREIEERTGGETRMGPGTLYGSIKRMLANGLIEESDERPDPAMDDQRRRYYRITDFGRRVAGAEAERLQSIVNAARAKSVLRAPEAFPGGHNVEVRYRTHDTVIGGRLWCAAHALSERVPRRIRPAHGAGFSGFVPLRGRAGRGLGARCAVGKNRAGPPVHGSY